MEGLVEENGKVVKLNADMATFTWLEGTAKGYQVQPGPVQEFSL